jgi:hypothetical protein
MRTFRAKPTLRPDYTSYEVYREQDHDDLIYTLALCVWWGETQPAPVAPEVDMSRGIQGLHTPRTHGDPLAGRPRMNPNRFRSDVESDHPAFDHQSWDEMKRQWGERGPDGLGPIRPERG